MDPEDEDDDMPPVPVPVPELLVLVLGLSRGGCFPGSYDEWVRGSIQGSSEVH